MDTPTTNEFTYSGIVQRCRPAKNKQGGVFGAFLEVAQMGGKMEFLIDTDEERTVTAGDEVTVTGHLEQDGYNVRLRKDSMVVKAKRTEPVTKVKPAPAAA